MTVNRNATCESGLGILMLDTCFPRLLGDIGHPGSFAVPVIKKVITRAIPAAVVRTGESLIASPLVTEFSEAARALVAHGAWAITSSCGFLVLIQETIQAAVPSVVVRTSSLLQLPRLLSQNAQVGVLTIDSNALGADHLLAAGVPAARLTDVLIEGVNPNGEFFSKIMGNHFSLDPQKARQDVVNAACALKQRAPQLNHLVLECTNMPPYQRSIEVLTGLTCWSLRDDPALIRAAQASGHSVLVTTLPHHA